MAASAAAGQQIQKVYSEWCVKAAEIILAARLPSPESTGTLRKSSSFNLQVPELFNVRGEAIARPEFFQLRTQRSFQVEIYLNSEESGDDAGEGELLERWTFTFLPAPAHPEGGPQMERYNASLIRKLTVVLRTLLFFVRLQPAHGICRGPNAPARCHRFRVEAWPPASRPSSVELVSQDFVTLQSTVGTLRLSVSQRKDLKSLSFSGPLKGVAAISSQTEKIELEEGFFATPSSQVGAEPVRLDKITEEPEVRGEDETPAGAASASLPAETSTGASSSVLQSGCTSAQADPREARPAEAPRVGGVSEKISTPVTTGPSPYGPCASSSSSRSITPLGTPASTPLQGPCIEPQSGPGSNPTFERSLSSTDPSGQGGYEDKMTLMSSQGADDLSNFWMSNLPEWGRRRGRSLDGSHGTGTSRSVSPEAPSRQPSLGDLQSSRGRGWSGSVVSSAGGPQGAGANEGEICLFGMSSDEEDKDAATEDDLDRNVVASAIMEGGGGGAFATASRMDAAKLGFPDFESDGQPSISRRNSDSQGASPKAMFSPLIAQLNPFQPPPSMDLPEADPGVEEAVGQASASEANVAQLVEEMGDLVCRLQQRQELQIVSEEVRPEDLYRRLDHFREFAEALAR